MDILMNSQELWLPSQDQGIQYSSRKEQEIAYKVSLLLENLQAVDSYQEVQEVSFLQCVAPGRYLCYSGQHHTYLDVGNTTWAQWDGHVEKGPRHK